ncbi:MAG: transaldolase [Planctomycetes bacterium]|nr:transaldolase [Planctomycetota bacterium]
MASRSCRVSTTIKALSDLGQSIWCDNISRQMLDSGELQRWIDLGVTGVTSNPTIFMKAVTGSRAYDARFNDLLAEGLDIMAIYEGLVLPDITDAADILRPIYERTDGVDGYVSLEVNPRLAYDTDGTVAEARRLFNEVDRPNVLIKVPATDEGIPAIETLLAEGINVNVTLIFGLEVYDKVIRAYINGVTQHEAAGRDPARIASVASFFISRVDTLIDRLLAKKKTAGAKVDHLLGRAAIANAKLAYARFAEMFRADGEMKPLFAKGARVQRPVWASTSTKNPDYPETMYVDGLVGPDTVNTLPPQTIQAALDYGRAASVLSRNLPEERRVLEELAGLGIEIKTVTDQLRIDGVAAFATSFDELLDNLVHKQSQLKVTG